MPVLTANVFRFWRSILFLAITVYLFTKNFSSSGVPSIPHIDKVVHLGLFVCFAFILMYDVNRRKDVNKPVKGWWSVFCCVTAYGAGIELYQLFLLDFRSGDWSDLFFDVLGTLFGIYIYYLYKNSRLQKPAVSI